MKARLQPQEVEPESPAPEALQWHSDGWGFQPLGPDAVEYGDAYWNKYQDYRGTVTERALNEIRMDLVRTFHPEGSLLLDFGIGNGSFLEAAVLAGVDAVGYDINPRAVEWLGERGRWAGPRDAIGWASRPASVTLWDVLEHLENPDAVLAFARRFVFVAMPTYADGGLVTQSKHYRPGEHCWYFTEPGLVRWMRARGFSLRCLGQPETFAGRAEISSFVFERTH